MLGLELGHQPADEGSCEDDPSSHSVSMVRFGMPHLMLGTSYTDASYAVVLCRITGRSCPLQTPELSHCHSLDVCLLGILLAHPLLRVPCIPLCLALEVQHAGAVCMGSSCGLWVSTACQDRWQMCHRRRRPSHAACAMMAWQEKLHRPCLPWPSAFFVLSHNKRASAYSAIECTLCSRADL